MKKLTFTIVESAPALTSPNEMVLTMPTFLEEIKACERRKGSITKAAPSYLRAVTELIAQKYDRRFNSYRHIVPSDYTGLDISTDEQTAEILRKMLEHGYPAIYPAYVVAKVRDRKFNVDHIWWVGSEDMRKTFLASGATEVAASFITPVFEVKPDPTLAALAESVEASSEEVKKPKKAKKKEVIEGLTKELSEETDVESK